MRMLCVQVRERTRYLLLTASIVTWGPSIEMPPTEHPMNRMFILTLAFNFAWPVHALAQAAPPVALKPARVFDGVALEPHVGWVVLVRGQRIAAAGPPGEVKLPDDARI